MSSQLKIVAKKSVNFYCKLSGKFLDLYTRETLIWKTASQTFDTGIKLYFKILTPHISPTIGQNYIVLPKKLEKNNISTVTASDEFYDMSNSKSKKNIELDITFNTDVGQIAPNVAICRFIITPIYPAYTDNTIL